MLNLAIAIPRIELGTRAEARTKELERCLALGADWVFMMDSDQTVPMAGLLLALEEYIKRVDLDVIIFDAPNKGKTDSNIFYNSDGTLDHFTISCCLIKTKVLDALEKPWFRSDLAYVIRQPKDDKNVYEVEPKHTDDNIGEDIYFSKKLLDAGINVKIMEGFKSNHIELWERQPILAVAPTGIYLNSYQAKLM